MDKKNPYQIVVDVRETALIKDLESKEKPHVKKSLDLGDIHINHNEKLRIIVERKTVSDLLASIKDGRYSEQSMRLINNGEIPPRQILYIIEGPIIGLSESDRKKLYSSMVSLNLYKGFSTMRTASVTETANYILSIIDKMKKNDGKNEIYESKKEETTSQDYCNVIKSVKKENVTKENIGEIMLMQIPGVSSVLSKAILHHFQGFGDMMNKVKGNEDVMKDLTYDQKGKTRKISKTLLKTVGEYLKDI